MWFEDSIGSDDESHGLLVSCFPIMQTCVLTVDFPEGVLARYKAMKELAPTTARARATVLFEGFSVHREVGHTQPYCRRHYTPGLLLGKPIHWKDYEIGLVDLMSIPRATALPG